MEPGAGSTANIRRLRICLKRIDESMVGFFFSAYTDLGQHIAQETLTLAEGRE